MKKIKITAFLKEFFIPNAVFYFAYLLVTTLVNMFFGNAIFSNQLTMSAATVNNVLAKTLF